MLLAALRDEFPVAAVDLPGHGERSAQPWSLSTATEIIASAVDSLDRGRLWSSGTRSADTPRWSSHGIIQNNCAG